MGVTVHDADLADGWTTAEAIRRAEADLEAAKREVARYEGIPADKREGVDVEALADWRDRVRRLSDGLDRLRRRLVTERMSRFANDRPAVDRARVLELALADVYRLCVDAQVAADQGLWEDASESTKAAAARLADAKSLTKLAFDGPLRSERGGQLALPMES